MVLVVPVSLTQNGNRCTASTFEKSSITPLHSLAVYTLGPPPNFVRGRCVTWAHSWKLSVVTSSKLQQCLLPVVSAREPSAASSAR